MKIQEYARQVAEQRAKEVDSAIALCKNAFGDVFRMSTHTNADSVRYKIEYTKLICILSYSKQLHLKPLEVYFMSYESRVSRFIEATGKPTVAQLKGFLDMLEE